jgi:hypothetical protein
MSGSLSKLTLKNLGGTLGFGGELVKSTYKSLSGTLGLSGSLNKLTLKFFTSTLGFSSGVLVANFIYKQTLSATLGMVGILSTIYIPAGGAIVSLWKKIRISIDKGI